MTWEGFFTDKVVFLLFDQGYCILEPEKAVGGFDQRRSHFPRTSAGCNRVGSGSQ